MLLLKGNAGKSTVVNRIAKEGESLLFSYYDTTLFQFGVEVDSNDYSISEFAKYVEDYLDKESSFRYQYLVIYTNESEHNIGIIKEVIEKFENKGIFRFAIITCREDW